MSDNTGNRGLAYSCVVCLERAKEFIGEKRHVMAHIYKYHVQLDQAPFYCSLCHFITNRKSELNNHNKFYSRHTMEEENLRKRNIQPEAYENYLHQNDQPKILTIGKPGEQKSKQVDMIKFGPKESSEIWQQRQQKKMSRKQAAGPILTSTCDTRVVMEIPSIPEALKTQDATVPKPTLPPLPFIPTAGESYFNSFQDLASIPLPPTPPTASTLSTTNSEDTEDIFKEIFTQDDLQRELEYFAQREEQTTVETTTTTTTSTATTEETTPETTEAKGNKDEVIDQMKNTNRLLEKILAEMKHPTKILQEVRDHQRRETERDSKREGKNRYRSRSRSRR